MIDALGVEFALVSDFALFERNKKKYSSHKKNGTMRPWSIFAN
jgi:hypothetical protein